MLVQLHVHGGKICEEGTDHFDLSGRKWVDKGVQDLHLGERLRGMGAAAAAGEIADLKEERVLSKLGA